MKRILLSLLLTVQIAFSWNYQLQHSCSKLIENNQNVMKKTIAIGLTLASLTSQPLISIAAVGEGKYIVSSSIRL